MSANLPAYDTLLAYCRQFLPEERITRVRNLVWLMLSLLHSTDGHLSSLAEVIALEATELSIEQRIRRWLKNSKIDVRQWYEPFVRSTMRTYAPGVIYVVMDTTQYGPSCRAVVAGVAYGGQVLPLGWRVVKGKKGHTSPQLQQELLLEIRAYLPSGPVVLVADSEFCAVDLLNAITDWGWHFIVRVRSTVYTSTKAPKSPLPWPVIRSPQEPATVVVASFGQLSISLGLCLPSLTGLKVKRSRSIY